MPSGGLQRVRFFSCGTIGFDPAIFVPTQPAGGRVQGPVPFYLLEHASGPVLVDTGCHPDVTRDPVAAWGGLTRAFYPRVTEDQLPPAQLRRLGLDPAAIATVVCTHLHMDHCGGNSAFPQARFLVHGVEWATVHDPAWEGKGYFRRDWDHPLNYVLVEDGHDLFGDGSAVLRFLPGHCPGHMSLVLQLPRRGTVVLAVDAAPFGANLTGLVPKNTWNGELFKRSVDVLRAWEQAGASVVCGHDPEQWSRLLEPPQCWE